VKNAHILCEDDFSKYQIISLTQRYSDRHKHQKCFQGNLSYTAGIGKRTLSPWQLYESKGNLVSKIKGQRE
jgi:hypothetical protein